MHSGDTSLGAGERAFPETTMGFAGGLPVGESLETLGARYWRPVYSYIRIGWAKSNEDAKDLTQAFFAWLLEAEPLKRYDPARGGFRPFLKVLLRRFVGHEERDLHRLKRGGGARVFSLQGDAPLLPELESASPDPDTVFDRVWREDLVGQAVARVRDRWVREGRESKYRLYEAVALAPEGQRPSYADVAAREGSSVSEVEKTLFRVREDLRDEVRALLARGAASRDEIEDEWKRIVGK